MYVKVFNNDIEGAMRELKKRLAKEGFFAELKERRFYDNESYQKGYIKHYA